jgi:cytochrome c oxidase assembly protein subunit 15
VVSQLAPTSRLANTWPKLWAASARPTALRRFAAFTVWALAIGIVSGGAVRLTGSGLGCKDWPACTSTSVVAPLAFHPWMEFGNRLVNALITAAIVGTALTALRRRPRRADLLWLSGGLVAGVFGEVVLGGETVLHKLAPPFVMGHFLLAIALMVCALALWHRSRLADLPRAEREGWALAPPARCLVRRGQLLASRAMLGWTFVVVTLGTVVTGTGPHAGAPGVPRFKFSLHTVAQLHGTSVELLLGLTVLTLWSLHRSRAHPAVLRRAEVLLCALVAQAAVGYTQYFTGDPVALVGVHIAGATTVVVAMCWFNFGLFVHEKPQGRAIGVRPSAEHELARS